MKVKPSIAFVQLTLEYKEKLEQDKYIVKMCDFLREITPKWSKSQQNAMINNILDLLVYVSLGCGIDTKDVYEYVTDFCRNNSIYQLRSNMCVRYGIITRLHNMK